MTTGVFDIQIDLYSLTSMLIETRTFYTVFLDIAGKQMELAQRKSSHLPGQINFNESLGMKVYPVDLEDANYEGKISVYSIHSYGRKKLIGKVTFEIVTSGSEEYKIKLDSFDDDNSYLQFRCRTAKVDSRVSNRSSTKSIIKEQLLSEIIDEGNISIYSTKKPGKQTPNNESKILYDKKLKQHDVLNDIRTTVFHLPVRAQIPNKNKKDDQTTEYVSISNNLELLQSCEKVLEDHNNLEHKNRLESSIKYMNMSSNKRNSKGVVVDKVLQMTNTLKEIHQKEDLFRDDEKILSMVEEEEKEFKCILQETFKNVSKPASTTSGARKKLRMDSRALDFVYFDSKKPAKLRVKFSDDDMNATSNRSFRSLKFFKDGHESSEALKDVSIDMKSDKKGKISLIKPKHHPNSMQEYDQWQNDDNLANIVRSLVDDVKGNLGYIKLSKLNQLRNQIKQIKDQNKHLIHANDTLLQNQKYLQKKITLAEQIIKSKQSILAIQFEQLRSQFKKVTSKLLQKYSQEKQRQDRIKIFEKDIQSKNNRIKQVENKLVLKDKQVQHYKLLLIADEKMDKEREREREKQEEKEDQLEMEEVYSRSKEKKFQRNSSSRKLFKERDNSQNSQNSRVSHADLSFSVKRVDTLKGINPNFRDFFMNFVSKPDEPTARQTPHLPKNQLRRGLVHKDTKIDLPLGQSNLFDEI